jgi:hypothetical protein
MMKKNKEYHRLVHQSYDLLRKNVVLLAPNAIMLFISMVLFFMFLSLSGLLQDILLNPSVMLDIEGVFSITLRRPLTVGLMFGAYVIMELLVEIFFVGMKYGMIRDVIKDGKTDLLRGISYGLKHYVQVMEVSAIYYAIMFLPVMGLMAIGFFLISRSNLFGTLIMGLLVLVALVYLFHASFRLLFIFPVLTLEHKGIIGTFKTDMHYVKTHVGHTFITWIIFIVVGIMLLVIRAPGQLITETNLLLGLLLIVLLIAVEFMLSTWEHIFIFKAYLAGKKQ